MSSINLNNYSSNNSNISNPNIIQGNINTKSIICNFIDNFVKKINKKRKFILYNDSTIFEKFFMNLIDRGFFEKIKENYCGETYTSFKNSIKNYNIKMNNKVNKIIKKKRSYEEIIKNNDYLKLNKIDELKEIIKSIDINQNIKNIDKIQNIDELKKIIKNIIKKIDYEQNNKNIDKLKNIPFYFYFNKNKTKTKYYVIKLCFNDQYFDEMKNYFDEMKTYFNNINLNLQEDIVDLICKKTSLINKNRYLFLVIDILPFKIIKFNKYNITGYGMNYLSILTSDKNNVINFNKLFPYLLPYFTYNNLTLKGTLKDAELVYSTFNNVIFNTSELINSSSNIQKINNSNFEHSTFNNVDFDIIIDNNDFSNCIFTNVNFKKISIQRFFQCFFENTKFEITKNTKILFEECFFSDNNTIDETKLKSKTEKYFFENCNQIENIRILK